MMKSFNSAMIALAVALALPSTAPAAGQRISPHESLTNVIDGNTITLTYGRPYSKDPHSGETRVIWGKLVPWDKPWRMGADEATTITTEQPLMIGDTTIPAGKYTLYLVPSENGTSKLAFCKKTGQWGVPVDTADDLARVDVTKESLDTDVPQFTMAVDTNTGGGGKISLKWEKTQYSVAFTVKK